MSIEFKQITVGPIQTNCYLLWDKDTRKAAIVDPGGNRDEIISDIKSLDLDVEWVLLTHGHTDHSFFAGDLADEYSARLGMHEADIPMLDDALGIAELYYNTNDYVPVNPTDMLDDGSVVKLGESEIKVIHTPGHSEGGLCFVTDAGVFCGDTIFYQSTGRTDFVGGSQEALINSIRTKILPMDDSVKLFPGHGPSTSVGFERKSNPYI